MILTKKKITDEANGAAKQNCSNDYKGKTGRNNYVSVETVLRLYTEH